MPTQTEKKAWSQSSECSCVHTARERERERERKREREKPLYFTTEVDCECCRPDKQTKEWTKPANDRLVESEIKEERSWLMNPCLSFPLASLHPYSHLYSSFHPGHLSWLALVNAFFGVLCTIAEFIMKKPKRKSTHNNHMPPKRSEKKVKYVLVFVQSNHCCHFFSVCLFWLTFSNCAFKIFLSVYGTYTYVHTGVNKWVYTNSLISSSRTLFKGIIWI